MQKLKILKKYIPMMIYISIFVILDAITRVMVGQRFISPRAILFSFSFGILLYAFSFLFKKDTNKKIYLIVTISLASILCFSQAAYYAFFMDFYSLTRLTSIKEFFIVKGETTKALKLEHIIYLIMPIMFGFYLYKNKMEEQREWKKTFICFILFFVCFSGIKLTFQDKMEDKTQLYLTDSYLYKTLFNKSRAIERYGVFTYTYRDLYNIISKQFVKKNANEIVLIEDYFKEHSIKKNENEKTDVFEGKNLVFIMAESLNTWGIHPEITPTLYKMMNEGINANNYMAPMFPSTTIDNEFILNTGMVPSLDDGNTSYQFSKNTFPLSLANLFKEKGYSVNSFHNVTGAFYNRYQFHDSLGYENFYDAKVLDIEEPEKFGYNWPTDYELFDKTSDILIDNLENGKPFMSFLITVSTHTPYDDNRMALKENYEYVKTIIDADSRIQYYLAAAKDLNDGIERMMQKFEEEGILEDTVFVLLGDHYSYGIHHEVIWSYYDTYKNDFHKLHNVPFLIWTPQIESENLEQVISQFEIYPTISNMFGLPYDPTYCFGNDIFDYKENIVVFGNRSAWQNEDIIFENNMIAKKLKEEVTEGNIFEKNALIIERLNIFQKILQQDYFNK